MKLRNKIFLLVMIFIAILLIGTTNVKAEYEFYEAECEYEFNEDGETITITDKGNFAPIYMTIPSVIDGYPVTAIGEDAFYGCGAKKIKISEGITTIKQNAFRGSTTEEIILPESLKKIETGAFKQMKNMKKLDIPKGVEEMQNIFYDVARDLFYLDSLLAINVDEENQHYSSEKGVLFNKAKTELVFYPCASETENYTVPATVTKIDDYAFFSAFNLKSVILPEALVEIGEDVFNSCTILESLTIPKNVQTIGSLYRDRRLI